MKFLRTRRQFLSALMMLLMLSWQIGQPLAAATFVWNQSTAGTNYSWISGANWTPAGFPNATDDVANLNNNISGNQTLSLNQGITLGVLNIGDSDGSHSFTLQSGVNSMGVAGYLTMDVASGSGAITKAAGANANDTILTGLQFNDTLAITNNSASGTLTLNGALRSLTSDITFNGTGAVATGSILVPGAIATAGNLIKNDAGVTVLSGASTYAGTTTVNGGTLQINNAAALPARSAVTVVSGATLDYLNTATTIGSLAGGGTVNDSTATTVRILTIGRDDTSTTFSGRFLPTTAANMAITKIGAGTLTLAPTVASTYTGATVINGGALKLDFSAGSLTSMLAATALTIAGGDLQIKGKAGLAVSQTLGVITVGATGGAIVMTAGDASGTNLTTGTVTATAAGGALLINAPVNTSVKLGTAMNTAITVSGRIVFTGDSGTTYSWAANTGATTNTIALATFTDVAGSSTVTGTDTNNTRINSAVASQTTSLSGAWTTNSLLINAGGATQTLALGANNLTLTNGGLLFTGANDYTISSTTGALNSGIATNSDLIIQQYGTGNLTINAIIGTGTGLQTLTKAGTGMLTLGGANTFTGGIFVDGGILSFSSVTAAAAGSLGNGSTTAVTLRDGATLQYTGATGSISGAAATAGAHTYTLQGGNANIEVTNAATALTLSGVISGAGGFTKLGAGTLITGVAETYTGPTIVSAGTLKAGVVTTAFGVNSSVTVAGAGTLDLNALDQTIGSLSGSGTITNSGGTAKTLTVGGDNTSTTFTGNFTGSGNALSKTGTGVLTLASTATSTWTGSGSAISAGVLKLGAANVLPTTGTWTIANSANVARLDLNGFNTSIGIITLYGASSTVTSQASITLGAGTLTLGGTVTYGVGPNANPQAAFITATAGGAINLGANRTFAIGDSLSVPSSQPELTISAPLNGAGFSVTKTGLGSMTLTGASGYTGATIVQTGTLTLDMSAGGSLNSASALTLGVAGSIASFVIRGSSSGASAQTLGAVSLTAQTYNTIVVDPNGGSGTTLNLGAVWTRGLGGSLLIDLSSANSGTRNVNTGSVITGSGAAVGGVLGYILVKDATGIGFGTQDGSFNIVRNTAAGTVLTTSNSIAGTTATNFTTVATDAGYVGGVLTLGNVAHSANTLAIDSTSGGTLDLGGATGVLTITAASGAILMTGTGNYTIQNGTLGASGVQTLIHQVGTGTLTISSLISGGAGILNKDGDGTLIVSNVNNAYTGGSNINAGILRLGAAGGATNSPVGTSVGTIFVGIGGAFDLGGFTLGIAKALTLLGNGVNGTGALTNSGGAATYSGVVTINAQSSIGGSGDITLSAGLGATAFQLDKVGAGTLTLGGTSTRTGATSIDGGTLQLTAATALGTVASTEPITLNGGTLKLTSDSTALGAYVTVLAADSTIINTTASLTTGFTQTLGATTLGSNTLNVNSGSIVTTGNTQTLILGAVTLVGSPTINIVNSTAGGTTLLQVAAVTGAAGVPFNTTIKGNGNFTTTGIWGPAAASVTFDDTFTGTGTLASAASTFAGGLTIKSGTVIGQTNAATFGAGVITLGSASSTNAVSLIATGTGATFTNAIAVVSGATNSSVTIGGNNASNFIFSGALTLGSSLIINTTSSGTLTLGAITGSGAITNVSSGSGGVSLTGLIGAIGTITQNSTTSALTLGGTANTFNNGLFINAGQVNSGNNANSLGAGTNVITLGDNTVGQNATLNISNGSLTYTNPILVAAGLGTRTISSSYTAGTATTLSGPITLSNDLIVVGGAAIQSAFTLSGGITGSGNLTLNSNSVSTGGITLQTGAINSAGSITNSGTGTAAVSILANIGSNVTSITQSSGTSALLLSGTNTYTGATTIAAGILTLGGSGSLAGTAMSVAAGATFSVTGNNTIGTAGSSSLTVAGGAGSTGGTLSLISGGINTLTIHSATGGATALTLGGGASNPSNLSLEISGAAADSITLGAGLVTSLGAGGVNLTLNVIGAGMASGDRVLINSPGGGLTAGGAGFTLTNSNWGGAVLSLANSTTTQLILSATANATPGAAYFVGGIDGSWNTFTGGAANNSNWATDATGLTDTHAMPGATTDVHFYATNATLANLVTTLNGSQPIIQSLIMDGGALANAVSIAPGSGGILTIAPASSSTGITLNSGAGSLTISAPLVLGAAQTWTNSSASLLIINGGVSGGATANLTVAGSGITVFTGTSSYLGTTTVNGILRSDSANGFNAASAFTIGAGGTLRLNGFSNTLLSLAGAAGGIVENATATAATLTVGDSTDTVFGGILQNGSTGTLSLTKVGSGALSLSGANTYTGNTVVSSGTLNITGSGSLTGLAASTKLNINPTAGNNGVVNYSSSATSTLFAVTGASLANTASAFYQTAGVINITPGTGTGTQGVVNATSAYGYYSITGGTFKDTGRFTLTNGGTASATNGTGTGVQTGVVFVGGTGILDQTSADWYLSYSLGQTTVADSGKLDRTGGSASTYYGLIMNSTVVGGSYGVLNVAGSGAQVLLGATGMRFGNSTTAGNGDGLSGFVNLAAGTLSTGSIATVSLPAAPVATNYGYFNYAGGTLKATATLSTGFVPATSGAITFIQTIYGAIDNSAVTGAPSFNGGLTIDTTGFTVTIPSTTPLLGATGYQVTQADLSVTGGSGYIGAPAVIFSKPASASGVPAAGYALISGGSVVGIVITDPGVYAAGETPTITLVGGFTAGTGTAATVTSGALATANSSTGGLIATGGGTLILSAANTFGGTVTIIGGTTLSTNSFAAGGSASPLGAGTGQIVLGDATTAGKLSNSGATQTLSRGLTVNAGSGSLINTAATLLTVDTTGITVASGGILTLSSTAAGGITQTTAAPISGLGGLTINNTSTGATTLNAANSYTGVTTLTAGTLIASILADGGVNSSVGAAASDAANLIFNGGTFQYSGAAASTNRLFSMGASFALNASGTGAVNFTNTGSYAMSGAASARTLTLTGTSAANNTLAGIIADSGTGANITSLAKTAAGRWILTGTNTYTGTTTLTAGQLQVQGGVGTALPSSSALSFGGGTLEVRNDASGTLAYNNAITVTAGTTSTIDVGNNGGATTNSIVQFGTVSMAATTLNFTGANGYGVALGATTLTGAAVLAPNTANVAVTLVTATNFGLTLGGTMATGINTVGAITTGTGTLTKNTAATWAITGTSTYTGTTTLSAGKLITQSNQALGTSAAALSITTGATAPILDLQQNTTAYNTALTGTGSATILIDSLVGAPATSASYTLGTLAMSAATLNVNLGATSGNLTSGSLGFGATTLTGAATLNVATGVALNLNSTLTTTTNTLTLAGGGQTTITGTVTSTVAAGSVAINVGNGAGSGSILTMVSTANAIAGDISINGGLLIYTQGSATTTSQLGVGSGSVFRQIFLTNGGTFQVSTADFNVNVVSTTNKGAGFVFNVGSGGGTFLVDTGRTFTIDDGSVTGTGLTAYELQGTGNLTKSGTGTLILRNQNSYSGAITISAGTLKASGTTLATSAAGITIQSGAALDLAGFAILDAETLTLAGTGLASAPVGVLTNSSATAASYAGGVTLAGDSSIGGTGAITLAGVFSESGGARALTKVGAGTLTLSNTSNAYSGTLTINAGTLSLASLADSGAGSNGTGTITFNNAAVAAGLTYTGSGATLTRGMTLSGSGGAITLSNTGSGALNLNGAFNNVTSVSTLLTLNATNADANTLTANLVDNGSSVLSVTKAGVGGTWVLSGTNTYSGATTTTAGILQFSGAAALPSAAAITLNGGAFSYHDDAAGAIDRTANTLILTATGSTLDVGNNGGATTGSVVRFGALTQLTAASRSLNITGANGYSVELASIALSPGTGGTLTLNPTTANISIIGNVTNGMSGFTTTNFDTLALAGSTTGNSVSGVISDAAGGAFVPTLAGGYTKITQSGGSTWRLSGQNTNTGAVAVQNGTLWLAGGNDRLNPNGGGVTLGTGTTSGKLVIGGNADGTTTAGSQHSQTLNQINATSILATSGTGTQNSIVGGAAGGTSAGTPANNSTLTLSIGAGFTDTYNGLIGWDGTGSVGFQNNINLVKSGAGTLILTGDLSNWTGTQINSGEGMDLSIDATRPTINISGGVLRATGVLNLVVLQTGGIFDDQTTSHGVNFYLKITGGLVTSNALADNAEDVVESTSHGVYAFNFNNTGTTGVSGSDMYLGAVGARIFSGSALSAGAGSTYRFGGGGPWNAVSTSTLGGSGGYLQIATANVVTGANSVIIGDNGSYGGGLGIYGGNSTVEFTAAQNYTGTTTLAGGSLVVSNSNQLGSPTTVAGSIILDGGILRYTGTNTTDLSNRLTIDSGGGIDIATAASTVTFASALGNSDTGTSDGTSHPSTNGVGGLTKLGLGTLVLTAANTYAGTSTVSGGILQLNRQTGSLNSASGLNFGGNGTFRLDNTGTSTALSQTLGALTFSAGDGVILSQRTAAQSTTLTFQGVPTRAGGATGNFTVGGTGATTAINQVVFSTPPATKQFLNAGLYVSGSNFAAYDATGAGYVRALDYTLDTNAATSVGGTTLGGTVAGKDLQLGTAAVTAQTTVSINSLKIAGAFGITLGSGQTLTIASGGLIKTGATATITGGTLATSGELVIRQDLSTDALTIGSSISSGTGVAGNVALTKSGLGTLTLSTATNAINGEIVINGGVITIDSVNRVAGTIGGITLNGGGFTVSTNSNVTKIFTLGLNGGTLTQSNTSNDNTFGTAGDVLQFAGLGARTLTLVGGDTRVKTFFFSIGDNGGPTSLMLNGSGDNSVYRLAGANTYTGTTTITRGILRIGALTDLPGGLGGATLSSSNTGGGNLIFAGTGTTRAILEVTSAGGDIYRSVGTGIDQIQWTGNGGFSNQTANTTRVVNLGGAGATLTWGAGGFVPTGSRLQLSQAGANVAAAGTVDFQNGIDFGTVVRTLDVANGTGIVDAILSGNLIFGSGGGFTMTTGLGALSLTGTNNTGAVPVVVSGGTLYFANANAVIGASGAITITYGATAPAAIGMAGSTNPLLFWNSRLASSSSGGFALDVNSSDNLDFSVGNVTNMRLTAFNPANTAVYYTGTLTPNGTTYRFGGQSSAVAANAPSTTLVLSKKNTLTGARSVDLAAGNLTLTASQNYSAGTAINTTQAGANSNVGLGSDAAFGTGTITLGTLANTVAFGAVNGDRVVYNRILDQQPAANTFVVAGDQVSDGIANNTNQGAVTYAGSLDLNGRSGTALIHSRTSHAALFLGNIGNGTGGLTLNNSTAGLFSFLSTAANGGVTKTYSGTTILADATTLVVDGDGSLGSSGGLTMNSSTLVLQPGSGAVTLNRVLTFSVDDSQVIAVGTGGTLTFTGSVNGSTTTTAARTFSKSGAGMLVIQGANGTYTGNSSFANTLQILGGELQLDASSFTAATDRFFSDSGTVLPVTFGVANGTLGGGGTLEIVEAASKAFALTQGFGNLTINQGAHTIALTNNNVTQALNLNLGPIFTRAALNGGTLNFTSTTAGGTNTIGSGIANNAGGIIGGYATFNGLDWAVQSGSNTLIALAAGSYTTLTAAANNGNGNFILSTGSVTLSTANASLNTLKLVGSAGGTNVTLNGTNVLTSGGVIFDNTLGSAAISGGTQLGTTGTEIIIFTGGTGSTSTNKLTLTAVIKGTATVLTKSGSGTLVLAGANTYTGSLIINAGTVEYSNGSATGQSLGSPTAGATNIILNGGVLRQTATNNLIFGITVNGPAAIDLGSGVTLTQTAQGITSLPSAASATGLGTGLLQKTGLGTLTLAGTTANSNLSIEIVGGVLNLGKTAVLAVGEATNANGVPYAALIVDSGAVANLTGTGGNQIGDASSVVVKSGGFFDVMGTGATVTTESFDGLAGTGTVRNTVGTLFTLTLGSNNSSSLSPYTLGAAAAGVGPTGLNNFGGVIQGNIALNKIGSGTQILSGNNTYSGATTINEGTLKLGTTNALPSGAGKGDVTLIGDNTATGVAIGGSATVLAPATLDLGGYNQAINGLNSTTGGFVTNNPTAGANITNTLTVGNGDASGAFSGVIMDGYAVGADSTTAAPLAYVGTINLTKTGAGTQALSGANTASGVLTVNQGEVDLNTTGANAWSGQVIVNTTGILKLLQSEQILDSKTLTVAGGTFQLGGNTETVAGVSLTSGGFILDLVGGGALTSTTTFDLQSGTVSGILAGSVGVSKTTGGTVTLSAANTFTGKTSVTGGILSISADNNLGIAPVSNVDDQLTLDGGTLQTTATLVIASTRRITLGASGGTFDTAATTTATISSVILGSGSVVKTGAGTLVFTAVNTYTGKTSIQQGAVSVASINSVAGGAASSNLGAPVTVANGTIDLGATASTGALVYTGAGETTDRVVNLAGTTGGGTLDQSGTGVVKFTSNVTATGTGSKVLTLQGSTAGTGEISGAIVDNSGANTTGVTKNGTGTWVLSGTNTYTGATTVNGGTLQVGTSGAGSIGNSAVTVNSTATLSGSGSIAGSTIIGSGGVLAPGDGNPSTNNATLTFSAATASLTVADTGAIQLSLTTADSTDTGFATWFHANPGGTAADYVASVGGIANTGSGTSWNDIHSGSHDFISAADAIMLGSTNTADKRVVVSLNNVSGVTYGSVFNLMDWSTLGLAHDDSALSTMGAFSVANNLQLQDLSSLNAGLAWDTSLFDSYGILVVVPEPGRVMFLMLGLLGLLARRRRRVIG